MVDAILATLKSLGIELLGAIAATVMAFIGVQLRRLADLVTVNGALDRATGVALDAMSPHTEGEPVDEGAAVSMAHDYLQNSVPKAAKRLGADLGAMARAAVAREIVKAAK